MATATTTDNNDDIDWNTIHSSKAEREREKGLYVGNLPESTDWGALKNLFLKYGKVISVESHPRSCCAFIKFSTPQEARIAMKNLQGKPFGSCPRMTIKPQRQREAKLKKKICFFCGSTHHLAANCWSKTPLPSIDPANSPLLNVCNVNTFALDPILELLLASKQLHLFALICKKTSKIVSNFARAKLGNLGFDFPELPHGYSWLRLLLVCTRILEMKQQLAELQQLRKTIRSSCDTFMAVAKPLTEAKIRNVEAAIGCSLPLQYRLFLLHVGDPGQNGTWNFVPCLKESQAQLSLPKHLFWFPNRVFTGSEGETMVEIIDRCYTKEYLVVSRMFYL